MATLFDSDIPIFIFLFFLFSLPSRETKVIEINSLSCIFNPTKDCRQGKETVILSNKRIIVIARSNCNFFKLDFTSSYFSKEELINN